MCNQIDFMNKILMSLTLCYYQIKSDDVEITFISRRKYFVFN